MCALSSAGMTCILTYVSTSPMILMTQRGWQPQSMPAS